jgi:hypothetical protein
MTNLKELKGSSHDLVKVLSWHFPAGILEKPQKYQPEQLMSQPRFELQDFTLECAITMSNPLVAPSLDVKFSQQ